MKELNRTKRITFSGLMCAIVVITTMFVAVPIPGVTGAYVNVGDAAVYASAYLLGWPWGVAVAAVGSALADIFLGSAVYAPATFLIKGVMALVVARFTKSDSMIRRIEVLFVAGLIMMAGYFGYECILYGAATALLSVPGNLMQAALGSLLGSMVLRGLDVLKDK